MAAPVGVPEQVWAPVVSVLRQVMLPMASYEAYGLTSLLTLVTACTWLASP
jgi:hypothetical protein